jgi:hypothetical protein
MQQRDAIGFHLGPVVDLNEEEVIMRGESFHPARAKYLGPISLARVGRAAALRLPRSMLVFQADLFSCR